MFPTMRVFFVVALLLTTACGSETVVPQQETPSPTEAAQSDMKVDSPIEELTKLVEKADEPEAAARWKEIRSDDGLTTAQNELFAKWVLTSRRPGEALVDTMSRVVLEHPKELTSTATPSAATRSMTIEEYVARNLGNVEGGNYDFLVFQPNGVGFFRGGELTGVADKHPRMAEVIQSLVENPPPGFKVEKLEGKTGKYGFAAKVAPVAR